MKHTIQEIGLPKSYSKRKFVASFKVDPELWSRFRQGCAERGVSVCHVLEALMEAWLEGQKATATVIKPVVVNLTMQHIVERPRRVRLYAGPDHITKIDCGGLDHRDIWPGRLGWCRKIKRWITPEDCSACWLNPENRLI